MCMGTPVVWHGLCSLHASARSVVTCFCPVAVLCALISTSKPALYDFIPLVACIRCRNGDVQRITSVSNITVTTYSVRHLLILLKTSVDDLYWLQFFPNACASTVLSKFFFVFSGGRWYVYECLCCWFILGLARLPSKDLSARHV